MEQLFARPAKERRPKTLLRAEKIETIVAVVPGIGTPEPDKWIGDTGDKWLESLGPNITPGLAVFVFPHHVSSSDPNFWSALTRRGYTFASDLLWLVEHERLYHCPIILVAHSLGGIIVKEALRIICEQNTKDRLLLRTLAAIILFGTPHSSSEADWKEFATILCAGKGTQKRRQISSDEALKLATSCTSFQDAHVQVPVISIHEKRKTKIRNKIGMRLSQKILLIEKSHVLTKADQEYSIGLDTEHANLCNIDVWGKEFARLCEILSDLTDRARKKIVRSQTSSIRHDEGLGQSAAEDRGLNLGIEEIELTDEPSDYGTASYSDPRSMRNNTSDTPRMHRDTSGVEEPVTNTEVTEVTFPLFMMPVARSKDFFGREEVLKSIEVALLDDTSSLEHPRDTPRTYAICGPGGIGKTQVAAEFVFRNRNRFDAVFWIHADRAAKIAEAFGKIAAELKLVFDDSPDARDPVVVRELVKGWLADALKGARTHDENQPETATWLIIFDNVDDPDELEDYWPLDGAGCVLFTGRDPYTRNAPFLAGRGVDLAPFSTTEAAQYLRKFTNRNEDGSQVADILGGFPLAITQIGASIVRRGLSFDEFVTQYNEEESHLELFEKKQPMGARNGSYDKSLASVWALEDLKYGAVLLNTLAFLDPDGVHERVLTQNPHKAPNKAFPGSSTIYFKARQELMQNSLIAKDKLAEKIVVHRLVQDAARSKMDSEVYRLTFSTALALVSSVWPYEVFGWRHEVARWRVCEELFPHVQKLIELARWLQPPIGCSAQDTTFIHLLNDAGWYYHESGKSAEARALFNTAKATAEHLKSISFDSTPAFLADLDLAIAEIHHNLGCVATEINDPEATLVHFQAFKDMVLSGALKSRDKRDLKRPIAWNELGNAYMLNKDWLKGRECFEESIKANKELPNYDPTNMSFPMVNLGLSYWFTGDYTRAASVLTEGLQHREDKFGKDDRQSFITGRFLHALGNVTRSQGQLEESFEYHKRGLNQYLVTLGKNHHRTGDLHVKVAEHHYMHQEYNEARDHLDNAICVFQNRSALRHEYCRALFKRSICMKAEGFSSDAEKDKIHATGLYKSLYPSLQKATQELTEADVDAMVAFWEQWCRLKFKLEEICLFGY